MMTHKDYRLAVAVIHNEFLSSDECRQRTIDVFAEFFKNDNPKFDEGKFRESCDHYE